MKRAAFPGALRTVVARGLVIVTLVASATLAGCVAGGYGYDDDEDGDYGGVDMGYGVNFYEPYGYDYGGWYGGGYHVGPPPGPGFRRDGYGGDRFHGEGFRGDHGDQGGGYRGDRAGGFHGGEGRPGVSRGHAPAYHPAPASRRMPSIPMGGRGWGGRGHR